MPKAQRPLLAALFLLAFGAGARSGDDPHSIEKIAKSLKKLHSRPSIVRYRLEKTEFWPKGSMNFILEGDDYEMKRRRKLAEEKKSQNLPFKWEDFDQGVSIPSEDITLSTTEESVADVAMGHGASKGERARCKLARDAKDFPYIESWLEPFEETFNGSDFISRLHKSRRAVTETEKAIRVPTGFEIYRVSQSADSTPVPEWLPRRFCEGCLPAPNQLLERSHHEWPFLAERWTRGSEEQDSEGYPIIYSTPWIPREHYQCSLRPDLHYVPCKWQSYYQNRLTAELNVEYEQASDGMPVLKWWRYRSFNEVGKLKDMTTVRVLSVKRESSVDPALFRLQPLDGFIVNEISTERDGNNTGCYVAGRRAIQGQSVFVVNDKLQLYEVRFQWFNGILAGCSLLMGTVVVVIFRRFGRRQPEPQPQGQELPT